MAKTQVYIDGNFVVVQPVLDDGTTLDGLAVNKPAKNVSAEKRADGKYYLLDIATNDSISDGLTVDSSLLADTSGTPYANEAAFVEWARTELGKPSAGDSAFTSDEVAAIEGAASPSAGNVFATMNDVTGEIDLDAPVFTTSLAVTNGVNTQITTFGTVGGQANQPIIGGAQGYEVHQPTAANTPARFYIAPKGTPTGTTSKFEIFNSDYVNDLTQYTGFHLFCNNSTNQIIMGPNHSNTGSPTTQRFTIYRNSIGSSPQSTSSIIDMATDETIKFTANGNLQIYSTSATSCGTSAFRNAIPTAANDLLASYLGGATASGTNRNGGRVVFRADASWTAGSSHPTRIDFETIASGSTTLTERWRMSPTGAFSNTASNGTAYLHLKAGTATASTAPLKFTSGTNLTTPEAGTVEFDGTNYFATAGSTRYILTRTLTGTAAPATTPAAVGIQYVDTTNKKIYVAVGTASSADWEILN